MKNILLTSLAILILQILSTAQQEPKSTNTDKQYKTRSATISNLELPATSPNAKIIHHTGYSLLYDEKYEQADWVAYTLTREETTKLYDRTDKFVPDPAVSTGSATNADYANSGFDRGHLAPAADMGWSEKAMAESFFYSNMSPQLPAFNRGIWKKLEEQVRTWASDYNSIEIVTGPVLTDGLKTIGPDEVAVPKFYYKVILDYEEPDIKGIGFILPNAGSSEPLQHFAVTIDSVERFTGLDFYPALPDEQEKKIEKTLCIECWNWVRAK